VASELRRAGRNRFEAKERGALARPSDFARPMAAFGGASSARDCRWPRPDRGAHERSALVLYVSRAISSRPETALAACAA
jgi:hypothetical protein